MDIQKRKTEIEGQLNQVRQDMARLEQMLRDASITEQRMLGALAICNEILTPEVPATPEIPVEQVAE